MAAIIPITIFSIYALSQIIKKRDWMSVSVGMLILAGVAGIYVDDISKKYPDGKEWPIFHADNVLDIDRNYYIVPDIYRERVQIYTMDLVFLNAWKVPSLGGAFKISKNSNDSFFVHVYRSKTTYLYSVSGDLMGRYKGRYHEAVKSGVSIDLNRSIIYWWLNNVWLSYHLIIFTMFFIYRNKKNES